MVVVLDNIRSVFNVGSIFRTADAAGVSCVYLCGITPAPVDRFGKKRRDFAKVSLGAEDYVEWERRASVLRLIQKLKKDDYRIFAIEQAKNSIPYYSLQATNHKLDKIALILGNEVDGLPRAVVMQADKILEIPMRGAVVRQADHPRHAGHGKESLNVAVAFGIIAFHLKTMRESWFRRLID